MAQVDFGSIMPILSKIAKWRNPWAIILGKLLLLARLIKRRIDNTPTEKSKGIFFRPKKSIRIVMNKFISPRHFISFRLFVVCGVRTTWSSTAIVLETLKCAPTWALRSKYNSILISSGNKTEKNKWCVREMKIRSRKKNRNQMNSLWPSWNRNFRSSFSVFIRIFMMADDVLAQMVLLFITERRKKNDESLSFASVHGYAMHMQYILLSGYVVISEASQFESSTNHYAGKWRSPHFSASLMPIVHVLGIFRRSIGNLVQRQWIECDVSCAAMECCH